MRAVDTNVLVCLATRDDPKQVAAAEVATAVDILLTHQNLTVQESEVARAALEQYRRKPSISFSDCVVLEIARKAGHLPLGTFDRELGKLRGAQRL